MESTVNSPYLVEKLQATADKNLFNHVKFNLVNDIVTADKNRTVNLLELGCGTQVTDRYLKSLGTKFNYFGGDYESSFNPDMVCDLLNMDLEGTKAKIPWKPDYLLLLDVLEHLSPDTKVLDKIIKNCSDLISDNPDTKVIVTLPQMYRLDKLKYPHLFYSEHLIRLTQDEWRALLEKHFTVESVQGVGFLSVIPFIPMFFKSFKPDNGLGRIHLFLRKSVMELPIFRPMDLFLSRTLGKSKFFNRIANDVLFELSQKK